MLKNIVSKSNSFYKKLKNIKDKSGKELGLILIEGPDMLEMAQTAGCLRAVITTEYLTGYDGYDQYILPTGLYRELSSYKSLPRALGIADFRLKSDFGRRVVYLDGIQDPGNYGTIVRTALAFGFSGVALALDSVSPYNSKAVQSTKGALFSLPIGYAKLQDFRDYDIYFTVLNGEPVEDCPKPKEPFVLVLGNEGQGIRPENLTLSGKKVKLEIADIDSLNVAVAAGIFMFLFKE